MAEAFPGRPRVAPRYTPGGGALHQLLREVERLARAGVAAPRLSPGRLALLRSLARAPKTASDLARERGTSRQSTLRVVESMLAEGWLVRMPNPRHRRAPLLSATPLGVRVYERAALAQADALNRLAERCEPAGVLAALRLLRSLRAPSR